MKHTLILSVLVLLTCVSKSQTIRGLRDDKVVTIDLPVTNLIQFEKVSYMNFNAHPDSSIYTARLTFGKSTFDLEVFDRKTGKAVHSIYTIFQDSESFKLDKVKSIDDHEVYLLTRKVGKLNETYEVDLYDSALANRVTVFYRIANPATNKVTESFIGVRSRLNTK